MGQLTLKRLPDADIRLRKWLAGMHGRRLDPGQHDCCLFGAGAVFAQTGEDLAAAWRGRYRSFAGGRRVLRQAGYDDHVALIADLLPEASICEAREGDIVILPGEDGPAIGICQGHAAYVLTASGRLGLAPLTPVQRLFKVG